MKQCGAKTRAGTPCKRAGMTNGRCNLHGGKTPNGVDSPHFIHGRYSRHLPDSIKSKLDTLDDTDPLDLLPELQMQRVLFSEYISRFEKGVPFTQSDVYALVTWAGDIGKTVERIVKLRNETALTKAEIAFIAARIPDVVMRFVDDKDKQRQFIDELYGIVGGAPVNAIELTGRTTADS